MDIRKPNEYELTQILSLSPQSLYEGTLGQIESNQERLEQIILMLIEKGSYYLAAIENHQIMGWILIGSVKNQFNDEVNGFIYELYVLEEFRGKGISKRLIGEGIDHLKNEGYAEIHLNAYEGNHAIKLYEKLGFNRRTVMMSLPLKFN
ncbi:GNAT family N-acetyltransferase [Heyndrickxia acidicola]|uniref:GNAT family N-acetyltransferase n=1 Tax=Heyndrickxia acidicola TaxID=209389 RepID=A0ABU6MF52_9BACI|nr:GNAT family N-acetyltransferase [Heyndrickxia acidicola]MED1203017.1 GNAT family N-acetyltransferase [Heyndrickxia acidicola]